MSVSKYRTGLSCVALSVMLAACVPSQVVNVNIVGDGSSLTATGNGGAPSGKINLPSGQSTGGSSNPTATPSDSSSPSPTPGSSSPSPGASSSATPAPVYNPAAGVVTTFAGGQSSGFLDAVGKNALFNQPRALAVDNRDGSVYVLDLGNYRIRKIAQDGTVTTIAGSGTPGTADGVGVAAQIGIGAETMIMDNSGDLLILDDDGTMRKVTTAGVVTTVHDSNGLLVRLPNVYVNPGAELYPRMTMDSSGNLYYMQDYAVSKVDANWSPSIVAGSITSPGYNDGSTTNARFCATSLSVANDGTIYVADQDVAMFGGWSPIIQKISPSEQTVTTLAGGGSGVTDGIGAAAGFGGGFQGLVQDGHGYLYAPNDGCLIRKIRMSDGLTTTLAGGQGGFIDGVGTSAEFSSLRDITIQNNGTLYVIDGNAIRKVQ